MAVTDHTSAIADSHSSGSTTDPESVDQDLKAAAYAWMRYVGYSDAEIAAAETMTCEIAGCVREGYGTCCEDEEGKSLHPTLDALNEAVEMARVVLETVQIDDLRKQNERLLRENASLESELEDQTSYNQAISESWRNDVRLLKEQLAASNSSA
jgi:hypothetical protein